MQTITDANFAAVTQTGPVVVKCTADWCQPCKTIQPILDKVSKQLPTVKFYALDVDQNGRTANAFGVQSVPTILFLRDGKYRGALVGAVAEIRLREAIQQLII